MHVASILHVTDLHLYLDRAGNMRRPSQRALGDRILRAILSPIPGLATGLDIADGAAWSELRRRLKVIVRTELEEGAACLIAQTGDVEAFGMSPGGDFTGWEELQTRLWPELTQHDACSAVDIYGNHDIWPGRFPLLAGRQVHEELAELDAFKGEWPAPVVVATEAGLSIRILRLNTVLSQVLPGGLAANGGIGPHPMGADWNAADIDGTVASLREATQDEDSNPALNVVLMHHPAHLFDPSLGTPFTTGRLLGRQQLAEGFRDSGIGLVLAGHRHGLNPQFGSHAPHDQPPLPAAVQQLVASSPTAEGCERSLAVYRLHWEPGSPSATIDRLIFGYSPAEGFAVVPRFEPALMTVPIVV